MPPAQELYSQFKAKEDVYSQLLAKGRLMLLNRDDSGSGSKTEQSVALLEQKWCLVSTKMEERKVALAERCHPPCPLSWSCSLGCAALPGGTEPVGAGEEGLGGFLLLVAQAEFLFQMVRAERQAVIVFFLDSHQSWLTHRENES